MLVCCFEDLAPWTEEELCRLYKNPQLDALDKFVDNFLKVRMSEHSAYVMSSVTIYRTWVPM